MTFLKHTLEGDCGIRNPFDAKTTKGGKGTKIVGGSDAAKNEWPWQVFVPSIKLPDERSWSRCGGSILNKR